MNQMSKARRLASLAIRKNNEQIVSDAIVNHPGPGSYRKVKSSHEAVQTLLNYISNHQSIAVRGCV